MSVKTVEQYSELIVGVEMKHCIEPGCTTEVFGKAKRCDDCRKKREKIGRRRSLTTGVSFDVPKYKRETTNTLPKPKTKRQIMTEEVQRIINRKVDDAHVGESLESNLLLHRQVAWMFG